MAAAVVILGLSVACAPIGQQPHAQEYAQAPKQWETTTETKNKQEKTVKAQNTADKQAVEKPSANPAVPNKLQLKLLIQTYMIALAQANITNNYTVLRALGSPAFQNNNAPRKLADIFANLRKRNIDLSPVILYAPILSSEPAFDENGLLSLIGYYPTTPQQVHFKLLLQPVSGTWRLFSISVKTVAVGKNSASAKTAPTP
jgi:hypothetical protein